MTEDRSGLHEAIEGYLEDRRREGWEPPDPESLLKYAQGELSETEARELQQRLVLDRNAIETLLDFESLPEGSSQEKLAGSDVSAWEELEKRIRADQNAFGFNRETKFLDAGRRTTLWVPILLGVACLVLGFFGLLQKLRFEAALKPTLDARVVMINLGVREADENPIPVQRWQTLRFALSNQYQYLRYRVDIRRISDDRVIYSGETNEGVQSAIDLMVHRSYFKSTGTYRVEVFGERDGQWQPLGSRALIVAL